MTRPLKDLAPGTAFTGPERGTVVGPEAGGVAVLLIRKNGGSGLSRRYRVREVWSGMVRVELA